MSITVLLAAGVVLMIGVGVVAWLNRTPGSRERSDRHSGGDTAGSDHVWSGDSDGRKPEPSDPDTDQAADGADAGGGDGGGGHGGGGDGGGGGGGD